MRLIVFSAFLAIFACSTIIIESVYAQGREDPMPECIEPLVNCDAVKKKKRSRNTKVISRACCRSAKMCRTYTGWGVYAAWCASEPNECKPDWIWCKGAKSSICCYPGSGCGERYGNAVCEVNKNVCANEEIWGPGAEPCGATTCRRHFETCEDGGWGDDYTTSTRDICEAQGDDWTHCPGHYRGNRCCKPGDECIPSAGDGGKANCYTPPDPREISESYLPAWFK